jgi:TatD DNase family protein
MAFLNGILSMKNYFLVDSHCHLNFPELIDDLDNVIKKADENYVKYLLTVNTCLKETDVLQKISEKYDNVFFSVGIHPCNVNNYHEDVHKELLNHLNHAKALGIGETGLDYYHPNFDKNKQITFFEQHLQASCDTNKPVIIHTRSADEDTIEVIKKFPKSKGVFHCFSGDLNLAKKALDLGFYISFSGIITFKNADSLRKVVEFVPIDRILVETDSPYLAPDPYRGKPNQPSNTLINAKKIGYIKAIDIEEVAKQTTKNFFDLFHPNFHYNNN